MPTLRIEHQVADFQRWKQAFDSDPADRKGSGVRRYEILRSVDDPNMVMIDLQLDTIDEARALLQTLREVWARLQGDLRVDPKTQIAETVEVKTY